MTHIVKGGWLVKACPIIANGRSPEFAFGPFTSRDRAELAVIELAKEQIKEAVSANREKSNDRP